MDAGAAWTLLSNGRGGLGVGTGNTKCYMTSDRLVECHVSGNDDVAVTLNHSEFLSDFSGRTFYENDTTDMAQ
jgi:hypothetical protein